MDHQSTSAGAAQMWRGAGRMGLQVALNRAELAPAGAVLGASMSRLRGTGSSLPLGGRQ